MSILTESTFSSFKQTDAEQLAGTHLTEEQRHFIQNQICMIAEERISLVPDPNNYAAFIQQEAHLKGQMVAYKYLLDCSIATESVLLEAAANSQQQ